MEGSNIAFVPNEAALWDLQLPGGLNSAFSDCNGNGKINFQDAWAIYTNYGARREDIVVEEDEFVVGEPGVDPVLGFDKTGVTAARLLEIERPPARHRRRQTTLRDARVDQVVRNLDLHPPLQDRRQVVARPGGVDQPTGTRLPGRCRVELVQVRGDPRTPGGRVDRPEALDQKPAFGIRHRHLITEVPYPVDEQERRDAHTGHQRQVDVLLRVTLNLHGHDTRGAGNGGNAVEPGGVFHRVAEVRVDQLVVVESDARVPERAFAAIQRVRVPVDRLPNAVGRR